VKSLEELTNTDDPAIDSIRQWTASGENHVEMLTPSADRDGDMNACIEGCFAAGATEVVNRDHHSSGRNVNPQSIDKRAESEMVVGPLNSLAERTRAASS
jgi:hypothetical protein